MVGAALPGACAEFDLQSRNPQRHRIVNVTIAVAHTIANRIQSAASSFSLAVIYTARTRNAVQTGYTE